jgi:predicted aldo/keto reductase-like oxidoreductase
MDVDNQAGIRGVRLAGEMGIPVVIMEGLLGGKLANVPSDVAEHFKNADPDMSPVHWAFKWLCNFPEIATVLSGVATMEQAEDNLRIFNMCEAGIMSEEELKVVAEAREIYRRRIKVDCTGCEYCLPCPQEVPIPRIFRSYDSASMFGDTEGFKKQYNALEVNASACVECGACVGVCPVEAPQPEA